MPRRFGFRVLAAVLLLAAMAFPSNAQRLVFAHYMLTNQDYQGDTSQEAKIAGYEIGRAHV